jgi:UDP-N-acetylglucosamine:LPS N-acetylglucosamine transferase/predicted metal-dependent phosphoesterase TrpH
VNINSPERHLVVTWLCEHGLVKKVLILTAGFGDGHNTAARNVADALEMISDEVKVEVLDIFQSSLGLLNDILKKTYLGLTRFAPGVWSGIYSMLDSSAALENNLLAFGNFRDALQQILEQAQPDCVISTYQVYAQAIAEIYRDHAERPFRFITVVTDSISVNSSWFRAPSDYYCVPNEATAQVLLQHGVLPEKVRTFGFPVSPCFAEKRDALLEAPIGDGPIKILYIINTGKKKTGKAIERLLKIPRVHLTIACGRDAELKNKLARRTEDHAERVRLLGWTNQMPRLMLKHHLIVTKAGGATVQECIAARCPMILNQVIPGQEEGNAQLVHDLHAGVVAEKGRDVADWVNKIFEQDAELWKQWRQNLLKVAQPDASVRIAELALQECQRCEPARRLFVSSAPAITTPPPPRRLAAASKARMLLCDFHIHTNYSDGKMTAPEVVDFYGKRGFDCICITDHLGDPRRLIGKFGKLLKLTLGPEQMDEYFDVIERERRRAWRKYNMLVMTGLEFNKDGFTRKTSAHLLGIDLKAPVDPALDLPPTITEIHAQGGLAVASHPHVMKSEWGKNTLYLWENQETFAPLIDAWEIANRNNIFTPVGLKRLAFVANSDFHKPKHIYSWKTLLHSEKDPEAIKECIRKNDHVAITLYRDNLAGENLAVRAEPQRVPLEEPLALGSLSA